MFCHTRRKFFRLPRNRKTRLKSAQHIDYYVEGTHLRQNAPLFFGCPLLEVSDKLHALVARLRDDLNTLHGREVKTTGDGFLAVFDSATNAVRCGAAMTRSAHEIGLPIRVGIHTGEIEYVGDDVRGTAVHAAARVMSLASSGEVLLSATTRDLVEGSGLDLEDAGTHELKGLATPRQVFRLVLTGGANSPG